MNDVDDIDTGNTGEPEEPIGQAPLAPAEEQTTLTPAADGPTEPPTLPGPAITPEGIRGPEPTAPTPTAGWAAPGGAAAGGAGYLPPAAGGPGYWQSGWVPTNQGWAPPRSAPSSGAGVVGKTVALILGALVLLAAGVGIGHGLWNQTSSPTSSATPPVRPIPSFTRPTTPQPGSGAPSDVTAIASKVDPELVDINTTLSFQGEEAAGTGLVITSSGEILTNNHVIEGATGISVTDVGNGQTYSATVVGYDTTKDLAVLQLHDASGLKTVSLGNSSDVSVGQSVVGIGNAGGTGGTPSSAGGSVTALNQSITAGDEDDGSSEQLSNLIESNADIQPGDSGGPLVNDNGQVLGIDTAASAGFEFSSGSGGGYSIPINGALVIAKQIEAGNGTSTIHIGLTGFLGVSVEPTGGGGGPFGGGPFGGSATPTAGAAVAGVVTGDPANEAGIATGDVITSFDGSAIDSPAALTAALVNHHPGDKVQIGWTDESGQTHTATVSLASGPPA